MVMRPRTHTRGKWRLSVKLGITFFFAINVSVLLYYFNFFTPKIALAATGDYRSAASGNWNSAATWETYNGTSWVAASASPANSDGAITIRNGHTVTITASVDADELVVEQGASIIHNNGTFRIMDGTGTDLVNNGTITLNSQVTLNNNSTASIYGQVIKNSGGFTFNTGSKIYIESGGLFQKIGGSMTTSVNFWVIKSGGTYEHADNGNNLPNADWQDGSTCLVTGTTTSLPGNLDLSFYNFTWNCTGQTGQKNLSSSFQTVRGNLTIISTGTGSLLSSQSSNSSLTVSGDYIQQGGVFGITESGAWIMYVSGNFIMTGGTLRLTDATGSSASGNPTLNITGNFSITGATLDMSQYTGVNTNSGKGTINLTGNVTIGTGGVLTTSSTGVGKGLFNFNGSASQTFSNSGTLSGVIDYTVLSGAILDIASGSITGSGSFNLNSSGSLIFSSPDGIVSSGNTGCIQLTGARTFNAAGNYMLDGSSTQVTGNGFPSAVNNLTINNSAGVTISANITVAGTLTLTSGKLSTGSNELSINNTAVNAVSGYSATSYVIGNLRRYVSANSSYDFPLGTASNYELANLSFSSMTGFTNILGSFTNANPVEAGYPLSGISVDGTLISDMLDYGYWTFTPATAMTGGTYSVTLNEKGHSNPAANPMSYAVIKRANISSSWQAQGSHNNNAQSEVNGVATAVCSALSSFSQFGIGKGAGALPIELTFFNAKPLGDIVKLSWQTAAEINNDYFTVERSVNGTDFIPVVNVNGAGNSAMAINYDAEDDSPITGTNYYRLRQTDFDGTSTCSGVVTAVISPPSGVSRVNAVYPNPFTDNFSLSFTAAQSQPVAC